MVVIGSSKGAACRAPTCARSSRFRKRRRLASWSWRRVILRGVGGGGARFCKVPAASADLVAIVVGKLDFDFVVAAIGDEIGRTVGDGVLISEFVADVLERLIEIVNVVGEKSAAASFVRKILENLIAFSEMHFAIGQFGGISLRELNPLGAGADGVNDNVGALSHFDSFAAGVIGKIVVAIADENHDAADHIRLVAGWSRGIA